jgi:hypothetical protein
VTAPLGPHSNHAPPPIASSSTAATGIITLEEGTDRAGGRSPQLAQGRSIRWRYPQPLHVRNRTRSPRASRSSNGCRQRGHWDAAASAFAPHASQRRNAMTR